MSGFAGKAALITGGTQGIGASVVEALAQLGARIFVCARNGKRLEAFTRQCRERDWQVYGEVADVTRPDDVRQLVEHATTRLGGIDVLVNNAGRPGGGVTERHNRDLARARASGRTGAERRDGRRVDASRSAALGDRSVPPRPAPGPSCRGRYRESGSAGIRTRAALDGDPDGTAARCSAALSARVRRVYELHDIEGRSYAEIARAMHVPISTIGTRLRRARLRIRALIEMDEASARGRQRIELD